MAKSVAIQAQSPFQLLGSDVAIGLETNYDVAPGPTSGSQRFYAAFWDSSPGVVFTVLSIDPNSGDTQVMHSPLAGEHGAFGMAVGPDGNIYLGTIPSAHFMRVNTANGTITDLGAPSSTETDIWAVTFGSDGRLYGVTYPNCKLIRYDPATGQLADLGRLDPVQKYAHSIAATADGYIYAGIGPNSANIAAYQISTGTSHELLPTSGEPTVFPSLQVGMDGKAYAQVGSQNYQLSPTSATPIAASQVSPALPHNKLSNGSYVNLATTINNGAFVLNMTVSNSELGTSKTTQLPWAGDPVYIYRVGPGPGGTIYGSGALAANLFEVNSSQGGIREIGYVGDGEVYSFLPYGNNLAMAAYYGTASLMLYNPDAPFGGTGSSQNPTLQNYTGSDPSWRPESIAEGADGHIYVGGQAGYGQNNGPLVEWNPAAGTAKIDGVVTNQLVSSLVPWQNLMIGGTAPQNQGQANTGTLFAWDTVSHQVDWGVVPVPGASGISDLVSASNGLIYGIADDTFFEFNPATKAVTRSVVLGFPPSGGMLWSSAGIDGNGRFWGLSPSGIFVVDTKTLYATLLAPSPVTITRGWAMSDGEIYFASAGSVYSYTMPTSAGSITISPAHTSFPSDTKLSVTVTVTGNNPTGTITLQAGTYTSLPTALSSESCTFTIPANSYAAGSSGTISAFYSGDQSNLYSSSSIPITPTFAPATVSIGLSSSSLLVGQTLNVSAAVSGNSATPTGTATLTAGSYTAKVTLSSGGAAFTIPAGSMSPGTDVVSVAYSGNTYYAAATGTASLTVAQATPTMLLSTSVSTAPLGSAVTAKVTVSGSTGTPTGTATLKAGTYTGSATLVNGGASFTIPAGSMGLGTNTISVAYSGSQYYLSGSANTSLVEIKASPTVSVSPSTLTASIGAAQSFTVTVAGGAGTPTGSVSFWGPSYTFGSITLSNGVATFNIPAGRFAVGNITMTASYSGDSVYNAGSANVALTETQTTASITVTPASSSLSSSKALSVTTTVQGCAGTPGGTVTLTAGSYSATATLSGGWASFSIPAGSLPVGTDTLTIKYSGNTSYVAGSGTAQVTVTAP